MQIKHFNIIAVLHHKKPVDGSKKGWTRRYKDIRTAAAKCQTYLITSGYVGDVVEFVLIINQMQVGAMKMTARGELITTWDTVVAKRLIEAIG